MKLFDKDGKEYEFEVIDNNRTGILKELTPEPEKWQCPEGDWYLNWYNQPRTSSSEEQARVVGNEYSTEEKTQEAGDRRTELEIINQCIMYWQEKLEPDWVCDFSDSNQTKYHIKYTYRPTRWECDGYKDLEYLGVVFCSQKVAEKVVELLNNGLVEGVKR